MSRQACRLEGIRLRSLLSLARLRDELESLCRRAAGARGQSAVRVEQLSRARDRQAGGAAAGHDADAFDEPPRPGVAGVARMSDFVMLYILQFP